MKRKQFKKKHNWQFEGEKKPKKIKQKRRSRELLREGRFNDDELYICNR